MTYVVEGEDEFIEFMIGDHLKGGVRGRGKRGERRKRGVKREKRAGHSIEKEGDRCG